MYNRNPSSVNGKCFRNDDCFFIVTNEKIDVGGSSIYIVNEDLFLLVRKFINSDKWKSMLDSLTVKDEQGFVPYWESDFRGYLIGQIMKQIPTIKSNFRFSQTDVSNALLVFGL